MFILFLFFKLLGHLYTWHTNMAYFCHDTNMAYPCHLTHQSMQHANERRRAQSL